jgi:hypothetical protein
VIDWQETILQAELSVDTPIEGFQSATTDQLLLVQHDDHDAEFKPQQNCAMCIEATSQITYDAGTRANAILRDFLPSLVNVQWMGTPVGEFI